MSGENVSDVIVPTFIHHSDERKNSNDRLFKTTLFSCYKLNFVKLPSIVIEDYRELSSARY